MKKVRFVCLLFILALAHEGIVRAQSPVFTGTCDINQISYTATDSSSDTAVSRTFSDVPHTISNFVVNVGGCARIDFSASIASESQEPLIFRVLLDQNTGVEIVPGEIRFDPASGDRHFSASFILPLEDGLGAGGHNVRIQWRSPEPRTVRISQTSVVTYHN